MINGSYDQPVILVLVLRPKWPQLLLRAPESPVQWNSSSRLSRYCFLSAVEHLSDTHLYHTLLNIFFFYLNLHSRWRDKTPILWQRKVNYWILLLFQIIHIFGDVILHHMWLVAPCCSSTCCWKINQDPGSSCQACTCTSYQQDQSLCR